jgi:hypothetical protein
MADTARIYRPDLNCDDCGKPPVIFMHWGPLTGGELKQLCSDCMKKRASGENNAHG